MKKSKYRSVKTEYNGVIYDSRKECDFAKSLEFWESKGHVSDVQRQVKFEWIETCYIGLCPELGSIYFARSYICDFVYFDVTTQQKMYVDVKGYRTAEYKKKKKIVEHLFNIKITEK